MMKIVGMLAVVGLLTFGTAIARADTVTNFSSTGGSCSGCPAATYSLSFDNTGGDAYLVTLTVNWSTSATVTSADNQVSAASFDIGTLGSIVGLTAFSDGASTGTSGWTTSQNGINDANCSNSGANFVCSQQTSTPISLAPVTAGGSASWTWSITGTLVPDDVHIGMKYNDGTGDTNGLIISDTGVASTPEPGLLLMLGSGLLGIAGLARKRFSL